MKNLVIFIIIMIIIGIGLYNYREYMPTPVELIAEFFSNIWGYIISLIVIVLGIRLVNDIKN